MAHLTISQSLRRIKKCKGRIAELKVRAGQSVSFTDEKAPTFNFKAVREELAAAKEELVCLEAAVAVANATTRINCEGKEMTLAEAIRRLQEFKDGMSWLPQLCIREGVERTSDVEWDLEKERQVRVTREVRWQTGLTELERVAEIESLRERFERLNDLVETANHRTEVEWTGP